MNEILKRLLHLLDRTIQSQIDEEEVRFFHNVRDGKGDFLKPVEGVEIFEVKRKISEFLLREKYPMEDLNAQNNALDGIIFELARITTGHIYCDLVEIQQLVPLLVSKIKTEEAEKTGPQHCRCDFSFEDSEEENVWLVHREEQHHLIFIYSSETETYTEIKIKLINEPGIEVTPGLHSKSTLTNFINQFLATGKWYANRLSLTGVAVNEDHFMVPLEAMKDDLTSLTDHEEEVRELVDEIQDMAGTIQTILDRIERLAGFTEPKS